jgi:hypothetical protein
MFVSSLLQQAVGCYHLAAGGLLHYDLEMAMFTLHSHGGTEEPMEVERLVVCVPWVRELAGGLSWELASGLVAAVSLEALVAFRVRSGGLFLSAPGITHLGGKLYNLLFSCPEDYTTGEAPSVVSFNRFSTIGDMTQSLKVDYPPLLDRMLEELK